MNIERTAVTTLNYKIAVVRNSCKTQGMRIVLVGYSFGAWVIDDWLAQQWTAQTPAWNNVRAVELYGDPMWYRNGTYEGLARSLLGQTLTLDPYKNTPPGYSNSPLVDRWQSSLFSE